MDIYRIKIGRFTDEMWGLTQEIQEQFYHNFYGAIVIHT